MTLKILNYSDHNRLFDCSLDGIDIKISQSALVTLMEKKIMHVVIAIHAYKETMDLAKDLWYTAENNGLQPPHK